MGLLPVMKKYGDLNKSLDCKLFNQHLYDFRACSHLDR